MEYNRKLRTKDYISLMIIVFAMFNLWDMGSWAFGCGCAVIIASLSLGTIFIDKENKEDTD